MREAWIGLGSTRAHRLQAHSYERREEAMKLGLYQQNLCKSNTHSYRYLKRALCSKIGEADSTLRRFGSRNGRS